MTASPTNLSFLRLIIKYADLLSLAASATNRSLSPRHSSTSHSLCHFVAKQPNCLAHQSGLIASAQFYMIDPATSHDPVSPSPLTGVFLDSLASKLVCVGVRAEAALLTCFNRSKFLVLGSLSAFVSMKVLNVSNRL